MRGQMFRLAPTAFKPESISQLNDLSLELAAYFFKIHLLVSEPRSRLRVAALLSESRFSIDVENAVADGHTSERKYAIFSLAQYFVDDIALDSSRGSIEQLLCFVQKL